MTETSSHQTSAPWVAGLAAAVFGLATILSGGTVLFGPAAARTAAGDYVPFVVWFNFASGFFYVAIGVALTRGARWSATAALALAAAIAVAGLAFLVHVAAGGAFEARTAAAMLFRAAFWFAVAVFACRALGCPPRAAAI